MLWASTPARSRCRRRVRCSATFKMSRKHVAGGQVAFSDRKQRRLQVGAHYGRVGTAGVEPAACGGSIVLGGSPSRISPRLTAVASRRAWPRTAKPAYRDVAGRRRRSVGSPASIDFSGIHDQNAIGHVLRDAQVVGDEEIGHAHLALQVLKEIEHARLRRKVERSHRLVQHEELRVDGDRSRNADALPLAAAELMRQPRCVGGVRDPPAPTARSRAAGSLRVACRNRRFTLSG